MEGGGFEERRKGVRTKMSNCDRWLSASAARRRGRSIVNRQKLEQEESEAERRNKIWDANKAPLPWLR